MGILYTKLLETSGDSLINIIQQIEESAPYWYLHGVSILNARCSDIDGDVSKNNDITIDLYDYALIAIYSESDYFNTQLLTHVGYTLLDREPTKAEMDEIEADAALDALRIAIKKDNIGIVGDAILNKHPKFRQLESPNLAIIGAALAERDLVYTKDELESF